MTKLQLIMPNQEERFEHIPVDGWWLPLNLFYLATFVKKNLPSTKVEIIDGIITNQNTIEDRIDADIVGISPTIISYPIALRYARLAKEKNPKANAIESTSGRYIVWRN